MITSHVDRTTEERKTLACQYASRVLLVAAALLILALSPPTAAASTSAPAPAVIHFGPSETGTKSTTVPVPAAQCRQLMTAAHLKPAGTACTHTLTAVSRSANPQIVGRYGHHGRGARVGQARRRTPGRVVSDIASSGWQYAYHEVRECWGVWWNSCYFLSLRADAWFQWNYDSVWLATPVECAKETQVFPYSGSIDWCGSANNGGAPAFGNNWGQWMTAGENVTACISDGVAQSCSGFWGRMAVDAWGNFWTSGGQL